MRIARLEPAVKTINNVTAKNSLLMKQDLKAAATICIRDVTLLPQQQKTSRCLYLAMELFKQNPDNAYVAATIGKCFNLFYENQKNHTLNNIVSLPSPLGEKNYNTLLEFIQKINLRDMAAIRC